MGDIFRQFRVNPGEQVKQALISILSKPNLVLFSFSFTFVQLCSASALLSFSFVQLQFCSASVLYSFSFVPLQLQIHLEWNLVKSLLGSALVDLLGFQFGRFV